MIKVVDVKAKDNYVLELTFNDGVKGEVCIKDSLFGVMFLLKGVFLIALPELTLQAGQNSMQVMWPMAAGFIGIGLLVFYLSFFHGRAHSNVKKGLS